MTRAQLIASIRAKESFLCVGLDPDLAKIPAHLLQSKDPVFEFNKAIIDATRPYAVAYKPNLAFYECLGAAGWTAFEKTVDYIGNSHFIIADAKRGDIGNTSRKYAETYFERFACDAVTIAPYMGSDSVLPFLNFPDKWAILLALTSNKGADDFQFFKAPNLGYELYEQVLRKAMDWGTAENLMFVVGATRPERFKEIRAVVPDHFLLVPGVGAQGGSLEDVCQYALNDDVGLLINSSRGIIYASSGSDFAEAAAHEAKQISAEMKRILKEKGLY